MSTVEQFASLDLVSDPEESKGAIDLLNVDLDRRGRVRSRDGYDNLTASAAASRLTNVAAFYKTDLTKQVLVASVAGQFYRAYTTAGATVASQAMAVDLFEADFTRFGGPSAEVSYATSNSSPPFVGTGGGVGNPVYKWNGTVWAAAAGVALGGVSPLLLEVKAGDNRLVGVYAPSGSARVGVWGGGTPETWGANDWVDLTPGDGERVTALVAWQEFVFAFKESKFFVFAGTSTSGTGTPVFNYRPVSAGVGAIGRQAAVATPQGVYFLSRRGIYKTTGGEPVLVSRDIDPVFRGGATSFFQGGVLNHAVINQCQLAWHDERLYFAYPSGSATTNDRILVFDPEVNSWLLWDVAVNGLTSFRVGDAPELVFTYASGSNHVGRHSSSYTSDDGTAISSRYQSGFSDLGSARSKRVRGLSLWGSGAPTVQMATDLGSVDTGGSVTLGTSPAVAKGYQRTSRRGTLLSYKLSASTAWAVNRLDLDVADERVAP